MRGASREREREQASSGRIQCKTEGVKRAKERKSKCVCGAVCGTQHRLGQQLQRKKCKSQCASVPKRRTATVPGVCVCACVCERVHVCVFAVQRNGGGGVYVCLSVSVCACVCTQEQTKDAFCQPHRAARKGSSARPTVGGVCRAYRWPACLDRAARRWPLEGAVKWTTTTTPSRASSRFQRCRRHTSPACSLQL